MVLSISSCREPSPPKAVITVLDANDKAIAGAEVTVYLSIGGAAYVDIDGEQQDIIGITNSSGTVTLDFKYEAIYDVSVKVYDKDDDVIKTGDGVLILEEGKTYNEIIIARDI